MDFDPNEVRANRDFFAAKLRAYKEKAAVLKKVKDGLGHDFVLLDVRSRAAFRKAHVQGAWCTPYEELTALMPQLPRDLELVTYCWNDY